MRLAWEMENPANVEQIGVIADDPCARRAGPVAQSENLFPPM